MKRFTPGSTPQSPNSDLLTTGEAAAYLGVKPRSLEVWRCVGRYGIPFIKVGRLVKYRKADLDAFLAARTHTPAIGQT